MPASTDTCTARASLDRDAPCGPVCMTCGVSEGVSFNSSRHPWLARCSHCGLQFANPQPSDVELDAIYDSEYFETFGFLRESQSAFRRLRQASFSRLLQVVDSYLTMKRESRLLDVGSALGDLLAVAENRGWRATGVERNAYAVEAADELVPGQTRLGSLEEVALEFAQPFDLVTCFDVLEHLRRPDESLALMHDLLRPGGGLAITTPDTGSLGARLAGSRWVHYHRDHLWYFNRANLARLVRRAGFEVLTCRRAWKTFNLDYICGIYAAQETRTFRRAAAKLALRALPKRLLGARLPPVPEGILLVARKI